MCLIDRSWTCRHVSQRQAVRRGLCASKCSKKILDSSSVAILRASSVKVSIQISFARLTARNMRARYCVAFRGPLREQPQHLQRRPMNFLEGIGALFRVCPRLTVPVCPSMRSPKRVAAMQNRFRPFGSEPNGGRAVQFRVSPSCFAIKLCDISKSSSACYDCSVVRQAK